MDCRWLYLIETENTKKVISFLRKKGDIRNITIDSLTNYNKQGHQEDALGLVRTTPTLIEIYLNTTYPDIIQEATFVHEILHILCSAEGYPDVRINQNKIRGNALKQPKLVDDLRIDLWSAIQHPYVFKKRNSEFNVHTEQYFDVQISQKMKRWDNRERDLSGKQLYFCYQQDIMWGIEYYFYPEKHKKQMLKIFKEKYNDPYKSCIALFKKLNFINQKNTCTSAHIIKKHIIKYGRRKGISDVNVFWEPLDIVC